MSGSTQSASTPSPSCPVADSPMGATPIAYCADCDVPLYRHCQDCGESERTHDSLYCDQPIWTEPVSGLCERCQYWLEQDPQAAWKDYRYGPGNW